MTDLIFRKDLEKAIEPCLVALCPTMDIAAFAAGGDAVEVCRFDGQRVFRHERGDSEDSTVTSLAWQSKGEMLSVMWSDGVMQSLEPKQGRLLRQSTTRPRELAATPASQLITHTYDSHDFERPAWGERSDDGVDALVDDWASSLKLEGNDHQTSTTHDVKPSKEVINDFLPRKLALMDLQTDLPRLSALPHTQEAGNVAKAKPNAYTTQEAVDGAFDSSAIHTPGVNIICTGWTSGAWNVTISNFLCDWPPPLEPTPGSTTVGHASSTYSSGHAFLTRTDDVLRLRLCYFNPIRQSSYYFPLITCLTQYLDSAALYILHTVFAIRAAYHNATDVPNRFISVIRELLQEDNEHTARRGKADLDAAFYHTASLGDIHPVLREWLADVLQERGHKRWDAAVTNGLAEVVRLTNVCLLPALDRASVITSRLRGLSRMEPQLPVWRVDPEFLTHILADLDILRLVGNHILRYAADELARFRTFSAWLGHQIVIATADSPESQSAIDAAERAAAIDHNELFAYITGPLLKSHLPYFLTRETREVQDAPRTNQMQWKWNMMVNVLDGHEKRCIQPRPGKEGMPGGRVEVVNLLWQALMARGNMQTASSLPAINFWAGCPLTMPWDVGKDHVEDMKMIEIDSKLDPRLVEDPMAVTMILTTNTEKTQLHLTRVRHPLHSEPDTGANQWGRIATSQLGSVDGNVIVGARFLTAHTVLALMTDDFLTTADVGRRRFAVCELSSPPPEGRPGDYTSSNVTIEHKELQCSWRFLNSTQGKNLDVGEGWECRLDHEKEKRDGGEGEASALVVGVAGEGRTVKVWRQGLIMQWGKV